MESVSGTPVRIIVNRKAKSLYKVFQNTEMNTMMKMTRLIAVLIMLFLAINPSFGEMTDYQKGVANGLKVGLFMGEYYGRGQYVVDYAGQYNTYLDTYNRFLGAAFGTNQTLMNEFIRSPIGVITERPSGGSPWSEENGRIFGFPAASYYTWTGAVPGTRPQNPGDSLPGV